MLQRLMSDRNFRRTSAPDNEIWRTYLHTLAGQDPAVGAGRRCHRSNSPALETNDETGTMLITGGFTNPVQFKLQMIGDDPKEPGLDLSKGS